VLNWNHYQHGGRSRQPTFLRQRDIILDLADLSRGKLLDAGCGAGDLTAFLQRRQCDVIGFDLSHLLLRTTREKCRRNGEVNEMLVNGDVECLPFQNRSFQTVISVGVLEYTRDYERPISEFSRVLATQGVLILSIPRKFSPHNLSDWIYSKLKRFLRNAEDSTTVKANHCVVKGLQRILDKKGFEVRDQRFCNYVISPLDRKMPRLFRLIDSFLENISFIPLIHLLAKQYMVKLEKCR